MTVAEVAREMGLNASQVREIERQALHKLRQWCRDHGLNEDDIQIERALPADHFHRFEAPE